VTHKRVSIHPRSKIPLLTAQCLARSNSSQEMPDFNQIGASWRGHRNQAWLTAELLPSPPAQLSTCHRHLLASTSLLGEFLQMKRICRVFGVLLLCSASKQPVGGEVDLLSGKKPPSAQSEELPVCSTQEMRGAGLEWKFFTASAKNSSEVKEVGTHSYRVISFLERSGLRLRADLFIDTFVRAASVPKIPCMSFLPFNTATTCGNIRAKSSSSRKG